MPRLIIKPDRDRDLYVEWSTVVDGPAQTFDRDELVEYLTEETERQHGTDRRYWDIERYVADTVDRVDRTGTSALARGGGGWEDSGFVVMNMDPSGWLPRERLAAFVDRLNAEQPHGDLLDPFDDEAQAGGDTGDGQ